MSSERAILQRDAETLRRHAAQIQNDAARMSHAGDRQRLIGLRQVLEREAARLISRASSSRFDPPPSNALDERAYTNS